MSYTPTYTFVAGTKAKASEVNQNFSDINSASFADKGTTNTFTAKQSFSSGTASELNINPGGAPSTSLAAGDLYVNSSDNHLYIYDGGAWNKIGYQSEGDITAVVAGDGLSGGGSSGSVQLDLELSATSGLSLSGSSPNKTLEVADSLAGTGLSIASKVISVTYAGTGSATSASHSDHTHSTYVAIAGDTMTGNLAMGIYKVTSSYLPLSANDLTNKSYVDSLITGLTWKNPVATMSLIGNATVATINGLGAVAGNSYVVTDAGTLTRGSVGVVAGDLVTDDGTNWVKTETNSGGFVPIGIRAVLSTVTALISPYTDSTDDGKIVSFTGASNTGLDTGDAVNKAAILVQSTTHNAYWENNGFTFEGTVPTGTWIQFTGTALINAGIGLIKTGNTLNVNLGAGIKELPSDQIGIDLSATSGLELTGGGAGDTLQVADSIAGNGLVIASKVLAVGAGSGISVSVDAVALDTAANITWSGNWTFSGGEVLTLLTGTTLGASEITGFKMNTTAGEAVVIGDVCYFKSDGKFWKADADAEATTKGLIGMALATIPGNNTGDFLLQGTIRVDPWAFTAGDTLFVSQTPGGPTNVAPSGTGKLVRIVGYALNADCIVFNPSSTYVEI